MVEINKQDLPLDRDLFMRDLLRHLSGTLQDVVGLEEASGFISVVGQQIGDDINGLYRNALQVDSLSREQVGQVLVDLKQRIHGNFRLVAEDENRLILESTSCPFEDKVRDRPSLCMMTSNVFGTIAAENLGYAKVSLQQTIARGDKKCRVVVYLNENDEAAAAEGNEYYKG